MHPSGPPAGAPSASQKTTPSTSDSASPAKESGPATQTFAALALAAAGMACLLSLLPAVGHDQMWCLYAAGRMLDGTKLYGPHLLESNPPLILWMLLQPAAIARLVHLPVSLVFKVDVLVTAAAVGLVCLKLLRRLGMRSSGLAFAFVCVFGVMPARDFGQRDHLLALLLLPYILAAAAYAEGEIGISRWLRIAIGIVAGLGVSLKPHHLLVPLVIEAALLLLRRDRNRRLLRPEAVSLAVTCAAYLAAIRLLSPEYLTDILPILRDTYWAIGHLTLAGLVWQSIELHVLAAVVLCMYLASGRQRARPLTTLLIVAGVASAVAYYFQGTGWYYQQLPALSFFALALWLQGADLAKRLDIRIPAWGPGAAVGLSALALGLTSYFSGYTLARPLAFPSGLSDVPDPSFFRDLPPGTPVAILTTVVDDSVPPITTHNLLWAQRENNLWTLPAILRNESPAAGDPRRRIPPERLAELDRMQHAWMVEDLDYWRPKLILVARCQDPAVHCQILEDRHDDLLAWFERDPAFRAEFAGYRFLRSSGPYDAYAPN
jgi:hypothetical protein